MKTSVTLVTFILSWGIITVFGTQFGMKGMIGLGFAVLIALAVRDYLEAGELEEGIARTEEFTDSFEQAVNQLEKANELIQHTVDMWDKHYRDTRDWQTKVGDVVPIATMRDYLDKLKELPHEKI